ncbi:MAG: toll/interleukin-1 receptor domain-containing protein [Pseudomonadota bacterium]
MLRYRAFISYCHHDEIAATRLHEALERYRLPTTVTRETGVARVVPIFRDKEVLGASADLTQELVDALSQSENLIVLCSVSARNSEWVDREIRAFQELRPLGRILAVIVDGQGEPHELFPPALLEGDSEPLAADLRQQGDGRKDGLLRLVAGLVGTSFERLKGRAERRRLWAVAALAVVSLVGMTLAIGVASIAVRAEREASRQAEIANSIFLFMNNLFRSAKPADKNPDSVKVIDLLELGRARIDDIEDATVKIRLQNSIADAYVSLTAFDHAEPLLRDSLKLNDELNGAQDSKAFETLLLLSNLMKQRGSLEQAEYYSRRAIDLNYDDTDAQQRHYARAMGTLALIQSDMGRHEDAEASYRATLKIKEQLPPDRQLLLSSTLSNLAISNHRLGRYSEALGYYRRALADEVHYAGEEHIRVAGILHNMANAQRQLGDLQGAEEGYKRALTIKRRVLGEAHPSVASTLNGMGTLAAERGDFDAALNLFMDSAEIKTAALGESHYSVANSLTNAADANLALGNLSEAELLAERALTIRRVAFSNQHDLVARSLMSLGDIRARQDRTEEAREYYRDALDMFVATLGADHEEALRASEALNRMK